MGENYLAEEEGQEKEQSVSNGGTTGDPGGCSLRLKKNEAQATKGKKQGAFP